jgi:pyruvate dehydrogenase E1 component beta subunit
VTDILMPALSPTMEEGTLAKWFVKAGDAVRSGDVIAEIETDKATMEVEAVDEGVIEAILVPEGTEEVKVNTPIARLGAAQGAPPPATPPPAPAPVPAAAPAPPPETPPARAVDAPSSPAGRRTTVRDALRDAMAEEMRRDETVFLMGEEVGQYQGAYKVSRGLLEEFGARRVIDTPITEHGFAGLGVGAAMAGLRPIVEFMTFNFAMQAIDHIINSAAKTLYMSGGQITCPIVFRGPNGAAARVAAQHSQDYSAWYAQIPGLKVVAPDDPDWTVPIGQALIRRPGRDVTLTAHSRMVGLALEAAEVLSKQGIEAEIVDLRTLRPLDRATIVESVKRTNRIVSVEEGWSPMGVGAEIVATVAAEAFDWLDAPPLRVAQADTPLPYAANLEALALPSVERIVEAALKVCYR